MKFIELAKKRCSIRGFEKEPVPEEMVNEVLQAGILAPTAKNLQPFRFILVRDPSQLDRLAQAYPAPFFREAPVVIVICAIPAEGWVRERYDNKNYSEVDAAIATDHMTLAAADLGLGTCWIGAFNPAVVREVLELPAGVEPIAMLPLGWPNMEGRPKTRKKMEELVFYDRWQPNEGTEKQSE